MDETGVPLVPRPLKSLQQKDRKRSNIALLERKHKTPSWVLEVLQAMPSSFHYLHCQVFEYTLDHG